MSKIMEKLFGRRINSKGQEVPDPTPVELPVGYKHPMPLSDRMRQMIKTELSQEASRQGFESWEEANDFNVGDGDDEMFKDEDDEVAVNDPFVERAYHEKIAALRAKGNTVASANKESLADGKTIEKK